MHPNTYTHKQPTTISVIMCHVCVGGGGGGGGCGWWKLEIDSVLDFGGVRKGRGRREEREGMIS